MALGPHRITWTNMLVKFYVAILQFQGQITMQCRYNAVQYVIILHTTLQSRQQDISQTLN